MDNTLQSLKINMADMLCFDVYTTNQAFGQAYKKLLEPLGITYPQYLVFVTLWQDSPLTVGDIGQRVGLVSSTLTPLIKRLEKKGLVSRKRDTSDERRVVIELTEAGRALEQQALNIPVGITAATGLAAHEFADLHSLLRRTRQGLLAFSASAD